MSGGLLAGFGFDDRQAGCLDKPLPSRNQSLKQAFFMRPQVFDFHDLPLNGERRDRNFEFLEQALWHQFDQCPTRLLGQIGLRRRLIDEPRQVLRQNAVQIGSTLR